MMKRLGLGLAAIAMLVFTPAAFANFGFQAGDLVQIKTGGLPRGNAGGPFEISKDGVPNPNFWTFCLEVTELLGTNPYKVLSVTDGAIEGSVGPAGDPLSNQTKLIFRNYVYGDARNSGAGWNAFWGAATGNAWANSGANNASVQDAIWYLEDEPGLVLSSLSSDAQALVAYATAYLSGNPGAYLADVKALNLLKLNSAKEWVRSQDVLTLIPEPASVLAWLGVSSAFGMGLYLRRRRSK